MRFSKLFIFSLAFLFLGLGVGYGAESVSSVKKEPVSVPAPVLMTAEGSVSEVDTKAGTLKLTDAAGKILEMTLNPQTTSAWKDGKSIPLVEIKTGEQAKVRYVVQEGKSVARLIHVGKTQ